MYKGIGGRQHSAPQKQTSRSPEGRGGVGRTERSWPGLFPECLNVISTLADEGSCHLSTQLLQ